MGTVILSGVFGLLGVAVGGFVTYRVERQPMRAEQEREEARVAREEGEAKEIKEAERRTAARLMRKDLQPHFAVPDTGWHEGVL